MFIWRHKILLLFVLLAAGYWYYNKAGQFGIIANPGLIIYDRIPVAFFDLYIDFDGRNLPQDDIRDPGVRDYWWRENQAMLVVPATHERTLIVGQGFAPSDEVRLTDEQGNALRMAGVDTKVLPTRDAMRMYNTMKSAGRAVAILVRIKS
jgi:hypothetical protein